MVEQLARFPSSLMISALSMTISYDYNIIGTRYIYLVLKESSALLINVFVGRKKILIIN